MDTIQNYKCPCCGAPLVFGAETQSLLCESCDNTFPLETLQQMAEGRTAVAAEVNPGFDLERFECLREG